MQTFQEKLEHACRAHSVAINDVCKDTRISPFSLYLQASGQKSLNHKEMLLLCRYFAVTDDYFTNERIRFIDEEKLPAKVRKMVFREDRKGIMCYQVTDSNSPDLTPENLVKILNLIPNPRQRTKQ